MTGFQRSSFKHVIVCILLCAAVALLPTESFGLEPPMASDVQCVVAIDYAAELPGMEKNESNILQLLQDIGNAGSVPIRVHDAGGEAGMSKKDILQTIRTTPVTDHTTLIVYYAGHGATHGTRGHHLHLSTNRETLLRSEILDACLERESRPMLLILITDCCSGRSDVVVGAPTPQVFDRDRLLRNLFLEHRGVVDITGATYSPESSQGEYGWYSIGRTNDGELVPIGGIFTDAIYKATWMPETDANLDGFVSWTEFMKPVRLITDMSFQGIKQDALETGEPREALGQHHQLPQPFCLARKSDMTDFSRNRPRRFGVEIVESGAGDVEIVKVFRNTPAANIIELNGQRTENAHFITGDRISRANEQPVRTIDDFYSVLDGIPEGETLRVEGLDANSGYARRYSAIVRLDQ